MAENILANIQSTTSGSAPGTWGTVPGLIASSLSFTSGRLYLIFASCPIQPLSSDNTVQFRLNLNGTTSTSPVLMSFSDSGTSEEAGNCQIAMAADDLSGTGSISMEWENVTEERTGSQLP